MREEECLFKCPLKLGGEHFERMDPIEGTAFCRVCESTVYAAEDIEDIDRHVQMGHCVAICHKSEMFSYEDCPRDVTKGRPHRLRNRNNCIIS